MFYVDCYLLDYVFLFFFSVRIVFYSKWKLVDVEVLDIVFVKFDLFENLFVDLDEFVFCYYNILRVVEDMSVLLKIKIIVVCLCVLWYNDDII